MILTIAGFIAALLVPVALLRFALAFLRQGA